MIANLLVNAVKFTYEGEVYLRVKRDPHEDILRIFVRDTGIGISQGDQERLFEGRIRDLRRREDRAEEKGDEREHDSRFVRG